MKNLLRCLFVAFGLAFGVSVYAHAKPNPSSPQTPIYDGPPPTYHWPSPPHSLPPHYGPPPKRMTAPEIDPSMAIGGLVLLAGALTVLRARRQK